MPGVDIPPSKWPLGRKRKYHTSQSDIEQSLSDIGVGGRMRSIRALPSLGDTIALNWALCGDGALCSWLHLPGVDVYHYELAEGEGRRNHANVTEPTVLTKI